MARGHPTPAGRPGPAKTSPRGPHPTPCSRAPDVAEHAGGPGARSPEQACDNSRAPLPGPPRTPPRPAALRVGARPLAKEDGPTSGPVYVLDTSVLLSDPAAFRRFAEHEVVLPLVVITELEGKRHHPELGWFARQSLRMLDELRIKHGRLDQPVPVQRPRAARCASSSTTPTTVCCRPASATSPTTRGSSRWPSTSPAKGREVTLVSKDMPLRVKAAAVGLAADEYRHGQASDPTWTGMAEIEVGDDEVNELYGGCRPGPGRGGRAALPHRPGPALVRAARRWAGCCRTRRCGWSAATARRSACAAGRRSSASRSTCCSTSRSASCRWAAGPAPASRRWRCARGSRRSWSAAGTRR